MGILDGELPKEINEKEIKEVNWEFVAAERLNHLEQYRDEMHAWYEHFCKAQERANALQEKLFEVLGVNTKSEVKVSIPTNEQMNTRRADWPRRKASLEKIFAGNKFPVEN